VKVPIILLILAEGRIFHVLLAPLRHLDDIALTIFNSIHFGWVPFIHVTRATYITFETVEAF
jgi:hypothetical protein